ncbi:MAG: transposase [Sphingobacteriales bacterium]|nr:transposase [Sphingobacteriales bacterium]
MLLAHARRKFYEAKDYDKANADAVLSLIQDLYKIESYCRDENFTPEQIKNHRHEHALPVIKQFAKHINRNVAHQKVLPKVLLARPLLIH